MIAAKDRNSRKTTVHRHKALAVVTDRLPANQLRTTERRSVNRSNITNRRRRTVSAATTRFPLVHSKCQLTIQSTLIHRRTPMDRRLLAQPRLTLSDWRVSSAPTQSLTASSNISSHQLRRRKYLTRLFPASRPDSADRAWTSSPLRSRTQLQFRRAVVKLEKLISFNSRNRTPITAATESTHQITSKSSPMAFSSRSCRLSSRSRVRRCRKWRRTKKPITAKCRSSSRVRRVRKC